MNLDNVEISGIVNLLTLRHNPDGQHTFRQLTPRDFIRTVDFKQIQLEQLIFKQITKFLKKAKPKSIVVPLSGGGDSTLILQLVKDAISKDTKLTAVSMGFGHETDETNEARRIAADMGVEFSPIIIHNVLEDVEYNVRIVNEPRWNTYYGYVLKHAKKLGADSVITGDGGDELFGGYTFRYRKLLLSCRDSLNWSMNKAISYIESTYSRDYVADQAEMFGPNARFSWNKILSYIEPNFKNNMSTINQAFMADFNGKLVHDYVPTNTALCNWYNLKSFSPMLTGELIDFACKVHSSEKYNEEMGIGKLPLRSILVQRGLSKFMLPQKTGYGTDLPFLWENQGYDYAYILQKKPLVVIEGLINKAWIDRHVFPDQKNPSYINKILQLVALEYYLRWLESL